MLKKLLPVLALMTMALNPVKANPVSLNPSPEHLPLIVAHRGFSWVAPENTAIAYTRAWEAPGHGGEVDVFVTKDGAVVCLHDRSLKRTTGVEAFIDEVTLADLEGLDAGSWKSPEYAGEPIPLLADVLAEVPENRWMFVEIKSGADTVPAIVEVINASAARPRIVVIGFGKPAMDEVVRLAPDIPVMWLLGAGRDETTGEYIPVNPANVQIALESGFFALNVSFRGVSEELVAASREAGMPVYTWTVNDPAEAVRLAGLGVTGITTDRPDVISAALKAAQNTEAESAE